MAEDLLGSSRQGPPKRRGGYWLPFEEAREYVRSLGLKSKGEYTRWTKSGERPHNIPAHPERVYADQWASMGEWLGWGDFLGTGSIRWGDVEWRPFEEARAFVRSLGFTDSKTQWREYCRSGEKPDDIPTTPETVYKDEWDSWGDWIGTTRRKGGWRSFEEARTFVRSLGLKNQNAWREWVKTDEKPLDIPAKPQKVYADQWAGMGDWLGTRYRRTGWRSFEEARAFVRSLGFRNQNEWFEYSRTEERPPDIPAAPPSVYGGEWHSWGDFLGTDNIRWGDVEWRPFEEAREFVRSLGFENVRQWRKYIKSGEKPDDIPAAPERVYADEGWDSWGDWFGSGWVDTQKRVYRPYDKAKAFVRSLGFRNQNEWFEYVRSDRKPADIPAVPESVYRDEWRGYGDFLGTTNKWTRNALLALLEDLRPRLGDLGETELYLILQQGGALPALKTALGTTSALGVLKDLRENDAREVEAALQNAADEDALSEETNGEALETHTPEELEPDLVEGAGGLASLATPEALRFVDVAAELPGGLDDETAQYLIDNRVAALWDAYTNTGPEALTALEGEGGHYFSLIRNRFTSELEGTLSFPTPPGWAFRPLGEEGGPPVEPNLMQRRTAYALATRKRMGNWSGVGSGKTLAGILASRITDRRHTLVICNKATVPGWCREIRNTFPDSVVHTTVGSPTPGVPTYTVLNYEKFQQRDRRQIVEDLVALAPDFVILDEVQFVKQRDKNVSARRQAIHALLSELEERNPDLHVLGMSATPVINTLIEARRLIEIVTGRTFVDLDTKATVNSALAMHRTLMIHGLRYRPRYEQETTIETPAVTHNELADALRAGAGVLHLEQTLLPAKLEAIRESIRPGTILYTHYVEGMTEPTRAYVERMGLRVGMYTGDDKTGLRDLLEGRVDVLLGSRPVGTGLDGLQRVCDQIIFLSLPWTSAEYEQTVGRIRRQGSAFGSVRVIVPQVNLDHDGDVWSWDGRRMDTIRFKRTLSDCALDGNIPEVAKISPKELETQGRDALEAWILRVREGASSVGVERPRLRIPLPPEVKERLQVSRGDFTTLNNRWSSANSETVHTRLQDDPAEWYLYHTLYREAREGWPEVPALRIAEDIRSREDLRVGDFGAGQCLLRDALPNHDVVSLDHVALDEGVVSCDMAHTPLQDGELGAAVFSLSLMGRNWRDYLTEAHRTLKPFGLVFIAEPARRWKEGALEDALERAGFDPLRTVRRGNFIYVRGVKY